MGIRILKSDENDFDDYLNLQADAIISMWGNNAGISLVNAILSSNGNLADAI